jgi:hypothetical protein
MRTRQLPENFRDWIKSPTIAIDSRMLAPQHREKPERGSAENTAAAGSGNDVLGDRRLRHTWNGRRKTTCQHLEPMALSLTPHASSKINLMTTVVGIFDNALDLDRAVERLARAGFTDTVYDEGILAGKAVSAGGAVFAPGYGPTFAWGSAEITNSPPRPSHDAVVKAFKAHLANYRLPKEVINGYATTFNHSGEFMLVKTKPPDAQQVVEILRDCGATRVNRHDA